MLFILFVFLLTGRRDPRLAREDGRSQRALVVREPATLHHPPAASS